MLAFATDAQLRNMAVKKMREHPLHRCALT
jgi:hypothetical protein